MLPDLTATEWGIASFSAVVIGISKCGFPGVGLLSVVLFASIFGDKLSTGVLLPMLCLADVGAVILFKRHAVWQQVMRTLPIACLGVIIGAWMMHSIVADWAYRPFIAWTVLILVLLQIVHMLHPQLYENVPHSKFFAIAIGLLAGISTMMANAAGPIMGVYFLAVGLPKYQFTGSSAWFFLAINFFKLPFSAALGLVQADILLFNALLIPAVVLGFLLGRWLLDHMPQKLFDTLILLLAAVAALWRLMA